MHQLSSMTTGSLIAPNLAYSITALLSYEYHASSLDLKSLELGDVQTWHGVLSWPCSLNRSTLSFPSVGVRCVQIITPQNQRLCMQQARHTYLSTHNPRFTHSQYFVCLSRHSALRSSHFPRATNSCIIYSLQPMPTQLEIAINNTARRKWKLRSAE